ncbi:Non-canonical purine NTP phosphatase [bacterium HR28]|nr:Non-canonical purine NTP phosphatase [bacterium HR28]
MGGLAPPVRLALGSQHPTKRAAVERVAPHFWPSWELVCVAVPSGVRAQPLSDEETVAGALARARAARSETDADFGIGLESGVAPGPLGRWYVVSWAVVVDREERLGIGGAERFPLPDQLAQRVLAGLDLATALTVTFGTASRESGAVAVLTRGRRDRVELLAIALLHALCDLEQQRSDSLHVARSSIAPGGK